MTRLIIDPLTRVEGHGRVELQLAEGRLVEVEVRLLEAPRLFEALVVGRRYDEVPDLVCRICAICSAAHKLAALQALEKAMGVSIPPLAAWLRELLLLGGHIQSHALHLFCLILPDLRDTPDIIKLLQQKDPLARAGLKLKAFGNRIQEIAGGRTIHPINPVFGGVAYHPDSHDLKNLAEESLDWQGFWPDCSAQLVQLENYPKASPLTGSAIATGSSEAFDLAGDCLWYEGNKSLPASDYAQFLGERSGPYSHAKESIGYSTPFLTGALARAMLAAEKGLNIEIPDKRLGIHGNNLAQVTEIGWALQRVSQLLEFLLEADSSAPLRTVMQQPGGGTGTVIMEAPRGLLVHHYVVDEWGMIVNADVVTPTAINQRAVAAQIMADLADEKDPDRLCKVAARIVRAFDPCISCAVHLVEV